MNKQRLIVVVVAAVGILAALLPWSRIDVGLLGTLSINGTNTTDGFLTIAVFAATIGVCFAVGDKEAPLEAPVNWIVTGLGAAGFIISLLALIGVITLTGVSIGFGLLLSVLAGAGVAALGFKGNELIK